MLNKIRRPLHRARRGFTLIELLVVLVILALLAGLVLPKFLNRAKDANVSAAKTQIANFKSAIALYEVDNGDPPPALEALLEPPNTGGNKQTWKGPYLNDVQTVPKDPWGNEYNYSVPGPQGQSYFIVSYGEDGREGGTGYAADITSDASQK